MAPASREAALPVGCAAARMARVEPLAATEGEQNTQNNPCNTKSTHTWSPIPSGDSRTSLRTEPEARLVVLAVEGKVEGRKEAELTVILVAVTAVAVEGAEPVAALGEVEKVH